jgi:hypothetical protein
MGPEELTDGAWYIGDGRGTNVTRWFEESGQRGLFISIRYHWWGNREWPERNTGMHNHYEHGGDFRPSHEVPMDDGQSLSRQDIRPLDYYHNGQEVGRWFPDENEGHFKVTKWENQHPVIKEYSYETFGPIKLVHRPEELSLSAQQKIEEKGL